VRGAFTLYDCIDMGLAQLSHLWTRYVRRRPDACLDGECPRCSAIDCRYGDQLHYHHDGCPSCSPATYYYIRREKDSPR
jgi:hypothetical protein